jgi:hypothetical protein
MNWCENFYFQNSELGFVRGNPFAMKLTDVPSTRLKNVPVGGAQPSTRPNSTRHSQHVEEVIARIFSKRRETMKRFPRYVISDAEVTD